MDDVQKQKKLADLRKKALDIIEKIEVMRVEYNKIKEEMHKLKKQ